MRHLFRRLVNVTTTNYVKRFIHSSYILHHNYEGDGKTTMTFLSKDKFYGLMVRNVFPWGFILNDGTKVIGPMVIFPKTVISWNVHTGADINENSLALFFALEPKLDVLVIGLDNEESTDFQTLRRLRELLQKANISHEILPVKKAISVFNFLNSDQRYVAAALITPKEKQIALRYTNFRDTEDD